MNDRKTVLLNLKGVVQGVGMRFFIKQSAKRYGVNGYVKNLSDGSVECLMQGEKEILDDFKLHIKRQSPGTIREIHENEVDSPKKTYHDFEVTF